ncbi:MAG: family 16 glycosylhydrolase [Acidobacteria bacterium]|nr:family 16 glycosylhydrolase [Acidobacteriota bacterium]
MKMLLILAAAPLLGAPPDPSRWKLAFSDEFEGQALDQAKWNYRLGPRMWSEQRAGNVVVEGGMLRIALKKEKAEPLDYTAGGVISKQAFRYGYYEARIRMPQGRGWHTSFWMMQNGPKAGREDRYHEIDVCEQDSSDHLSYSVNWHSYKPHVSFGHRKVAGPDLAADFHVYGAEFTASRVRFYLDGRPVHSIDVSAVPHYEQHIWLTSIATWLGKTGSVEDAALPETALFDWVRYYRPAEPAQSQPAQPDISRMIRPLPETAKFSDPDYYIWCGSAVRGDDGKYHLYYSRWPRALGHSAWVTHSEIAHAVADAPTGPYKHVGVVLPRRGRQYWDGLCTHNPTILRAGDRYYLYYMGNTGDDQAMKTLNWTHRNNQRVGVAVAESPNGPWQRFDQPLVDVSADTGAPDALVVTNPSVARRPDGGYLMVYKAVGRQRALPFGGPVVHLTATSDSPTGPFTKQLKPIFLAPGVDFPAEDPFLWYDYAAGRYMAVVKDNAGYFTKAGKSLCLWESIDGLDWRLASNPLVSRIEVTWEGGRVEKLHSLERPQLLFGPDGRPIALLAAADEDAARGHSFNLQIPLGSN